MRLMLAIALLSVSAHAHDFWIEPSTFRPSAGQAITFSLRVGQNFTGDPVPRSAQLLVSFTIRDAGGERPVGGFENLDPAGYFRVDKTGLAVIGYRSKANRLELPAEKFSEFLQTEGIVLIRDLYKPDREYFYRYAKSIIGSGTAGFDQRFGFRFEIVPESNPLDAPLLRLRVLFEGKPLAGALVTAIDHGGMRMSARSDSRGRVAFSLPKRGVWLIKSVWIVPAQPGSDVDWESLWASLTFER